ncbi:MAG: glycosyltransferase [Candidatus Omnitrophica bacterium]|nr:glycosyltransferase [Candidatus Omnitrophota bacterium]
MKILFLTSEMPYPPHFGGAKIVSYQIMKALHKAHEIHLLSFVDNEDELKFADALKEVTVTRRFILRKPHHSPRPLWALYNPYRSYKTDEVRQALAEMIAENRFDMVHSDAPMAVYINDLPDDLAKIVCPTDSRTLAQVPNMRNAKDPRSFIVAFYRFYSFRNFERSFYRRFNACLAVTKEGGGYLGKLCPGLKIGVIPNAVDVEYFKPSDMPIDPNTLVFTGTMDYAPNIDAVIYFTKKIMPLVKKKRSQIKFFIVGRNPVPEVKMLANEPNVIVTGDVDDIRKYLAQAAVFVCPVRLGTGIKNKVLEAMAMGKAIVLTSISAQGINAQDGQDFITADTSEKFADNVLNVLENKTRREQMGRAAREVVVKKYVFDIIGKKYEDFYGSIINRSSKFVS